MRPTCQLESTPKWSRLRSARQIQTDVAQVVGSKVLAGKTRTYPDPEVTPRGCFNDVRQIGMLLHGHFGFTGARAMRQLTDAHATTAATLAGLHWLVAPASPGTRAGSTTPATAHRRPTVTASRRPFTDALPSAKAARERWRTLRAAARERGLGLLDISVKTAMSHREHIMQELDLHSRTDLIKFALQKGVIRVD